MYWGGKIPEGWKIEAEIAEHGAYVKLPCACCNISSRDSARDNKSARKTNCDEEFIWVIASRWLFSWVVT